MLSSRVARPTLRLTITGALVLMTGATAATITLLSYRSARRNLLDTYRLVLTQVAERISERTKGYLGPVKNAAAVSAGLLESGAAA